MERQNIKVGMKCKVLDSEDGNWYETEVIRTEPKIVLMDVDPNSQWQGLEFDLLEGEENDTHYIKWL